MNFLSHYYLHKEIDDVYFTVGLSLPDLFGFISRRIRITERFLYGSIEEIQDQRLVSLLRGMICHIKIDKWFHSSSFFKKHLLNMREIAIRYKAPDFADFHAHILLEILIDRYLLFKFPDIAKDFYGYYQYIDYCFIATPFLKLDSFEKPRFCDFLTNFSRSTFLYEYKEYESILHIINRVCSRIGVATISSSCTELYISLFQRFYSFIYPDLEVLFAEARAIKIT